MTDATLLAFGCGVTFIALGGFYSYFRFSFQAKAKPTAEHLARGESS